MQQYIIIYELIWQKAFYISDWQTRFSFYNEKNKIIVGLFMLLKIKGTK